MELKYFFAISFREIICSKAKLAGQILQDHVSHRTVNVRYFLMVILKQQLDKGALWLAGFCKLSQ